MARFERSGVGKGRKDSRDRKESRASGRESSFEDYSKRKGSSRSRGSSRDRDDRAGRDSGRSSFGRRSSGRGRRDSGRGKLEMTEVICSECGKKCMVPFKPTSNKPVYCSDCFEKREKGSSNEPSNRDIDIINEKLNKIMKALKID